jgi:hypothetical protein
LCRIDRDEHLAAAELMAAYESYVSASRELAAARYWLRHHQYKEGRQTLVDVIRKMDRADFDGIWNSRGYAPWIVEFSVYLWRMETAVWPRLDDLGAFTEETFGLGDEVMDWIGWTINNPSEEEAGVFLRPERHMREILGLEFPALDFPNADEDGFRAYVSAEIQEAHDMAALWEFWQLRRYTRPA